MNDKVIVYGIMSEIAAIDGKYCGMCKMYGDTVKRCHFIGEDLELNENGKPLRKCMTKQEFDLYRGVAADIVRELAEISRNTELNRMELTKVVKKIWGGE